MWKFIAVALSSSLISLILSHLLIFHFALGDNESQSSCTESFECGSFGGMSFPFSKSTEPNCGLSVVDCDTEPPRLKLSPKGDWYITAQHANIFTIQALWLQDLQGCQSFDDLSLPNSASLSFTVFPNITLFKCNTSSSDQSLDHHFAGYEKFTNCEQSGFNVYYNNTYETVSSTLPTAPLGCSIIQLPLVGFNRTMKPTELFKLLASTFYLEWHVSAECYDCHHRGGQCVTDKENRLRCYKDLGEGSHISRLILGIVVSASGSAILTITVFCLRRKCSIFYCRKNEHRDVEAFLRINNGLHAPKRYHYSDVRKMTSSFKIRLGQGGYGSVFKGKLHDGRLVAVKILNDIKENGEEFINEVASISRTSHVNIVKLLGFCVERNRRALIYEFMPKGSLEKFIYDKQSSLDHQLGWQTLYKITIGIARGLEYLHCGCNTQILHFDIKPHNILLDEEFSPKISDFGLSKLCTRKISNVSILGARGTIGYIAPEVVCKSFGGVSHKSDVYSYGMMILEMVGGRKNFDVGVAHTSQIYYLHWVYKRLELNQELELEEILTEEENEKARKMIIVSLWCIQTNPSTRPSITKVVEMLEGNLESLQIPPRPYFYSPPSSPIRLSSIQIT